MPLLPSSHIFVVCAAFAATLSSGFTHRRPGIQRVALNYSVRDTLITTKPWGNSQQASSTSVLLSTPEIFEPSTERLTQSYRAGMYAFGAAAVLIFVMPDRTLTTLLATKWGGSAGFGIAAGLSRILSAATAENRLSSYTYKRINLGLLGFCSLGLSALPGEAAFLNSSDAAMVMAGALTALRLFGTLISFMGWKRGVTDGSPRGLVAELVQGTKDTVLGLKVQFSKKALTYRNCLVMVCLGIVSNFMGGLFSIRYQKEFTRTWFEISLHWSAVSRLFMIASIIYSLKDSAERDRLTGTTFIEMNIMVGSWALLVGLSQAVYPLGFAAYRGVEMFAFSIPFFLKAYKSRREKASLAEELL